MRFTRQWVRSAGAKQMKFEPKRFSNTALAGYVVADCKSQLLQLASQLDGRFNPDEEFSLMWNKVFNIFQQLEEFRRPG